MTIVVPPDMRGIFLSAGPAGPPASPPSGQGIYLNGPLFYDIASAQPVVPIGAAIVSLTEHEGNGSRWPGEASLSSAQIATAILDAYNSLVAAGKPYGKINTVRVPWSSFAWMGYQGVVPFSDATGSFTLVSGSTYKCAVSASTYQSYVLELVNAVLGASAILGYQMYVVLDLHWSTQIRDSDGAYLCPCGQSGMPSTADVAAWESLATAIQGISGCQCVMFEGFNEPVYDGVYADALSTTGVANLGGSSMVVIGGAMEDNIGTDTGVNPLGYNVRSVGHQALLNGIRGTGATNVYLAGPPWFSGDIELWLQMGITDSINQLGATYHGYGGPASGGLTSFENIRSAGRGIFVSELGTLSNPDFSSTFVHFYSRGWGYCFWAGSSNGDWNNWGSQSANTIAPIMAADPPWTNNGSVTPNGSN